MYVCCASFHLYLASLVIVCLVSPIMHVYMQLIYGDGCTWADCCLHGVGLLSYTLSLLTPQSFSSSPKPDTATANIPLTVHSSGATQHKWPWALTPSLPHCLSSQQHTNTLIRLPLPPPPSFWPTHSLTRITPERKKYGGSVLFYRSNTLLCFRTLPQTLLLHQIVVVFESFKDSSFPRLLTVTAPLCCLPEGIALYQ